MVFLPAKRYRIFRSGRGPADHRWLVSTTSVEFRKVNWLMTHSHRPRGGATKKSPSNDWDDPRVGVYFGQQAAFVSRTPTRAIPTQTATVVPVPVNPGGKKSNIGAIVGGTVGGIAVLLLAIGLVFFCLKKRKRHQQAQVGSAPAPGQTNVAYPPSPTSGYASEAKFSVVGPASTTQVGSPNLSSHSPVHSYTHPSPYTTPPPVPSTSPTYHPAHAPAPMEYYPPPDGSRPNLAYVGRHEMPAVKSPHQSTNIVQPWPKRSGRGDDEER